MNEAEEARSELKIRKIANGWLLKGRDGWTAHNSVTELLTAVERALTSESDGQTRFFHADHPARRPNG